MHGSGDTYVLTRIITACFLPGMGLLRAPLARPEGKGLLRREPGGTARQGEQGGAAGLRWMAGRGERRRGRRKGEKKCEKKGGEGCRKNGVWPSGCSPSSR